MAAAKSDRHKNADVGGRGILRFAEIKAILSGDQRARRWPFLFSSRAANATSCSSRRDSPRSLQRLTDWSSTRGKFHHYVSSFIVLHKTCIDYVC